jgi:hypothetical protein
LKEKTGNQNKKPLSVEKTQAVSVSKQFAVISSCTPPFAANPGHWGRGVTFTDGETSLAGSFVGKVIPPCMPSSYCRAALAARS